METPLLTNLALPWAVMRVVLFFIFPGLGALSRFFGSLYWPAQKDWGFFLLGIQPRSLAISVFVRGFSGV